MERRQAQKYLLLILAFSSLLYFGLGYLEQRRPELFVDPEADPQSYRAKQLSSLEKLELQQSTEHQNLKPNDRGVYEWDSDSVLPVYHQAELGIYRNRSKNDKALEGILIFIDPGDKPIRERTVQAEEDAIPFRIAETDKHSKLPVSGFAERKRRQTKKARLPDIPRSQILSHLAESLQQRLEGMGAEVLMTNDLAQHKSEQAQAAAIAYELSGRFLDELEAGQFNLPELREMRPALLEIAETGKQDLARTYLSAAGVSPDLRLLLDMQRQYKDVLLLSLRLGTGGEEESGTQVRYFSAGLASNIGSKELDVAGRYPAYTAYDTSARRWLAEAVERNIRGLLPELAYQGSALAVAEEILVLGRLSNVTAIEIRPAFESREDNMDALQKQELQLSLAEAIAYACYQFYAER